MNAKYFSDLIDKFTEDELESLRDQAEKLINEKEKLINKYKNISKEDARENGVLDALLSDISANNYAIIDNENNIARLSRDSSIKKYNPVGKALLYSTVAIRNEKEDFSGVYRILPGLVSYPDAGIETINGEEVYYGIISEESPVAKAVNGLQKGDEFTVGGSISTQYKIIDIY